MSTLRDLAREAKDAKERLVSIPEWGEGYQLLIRELTGEDFVWFARLAFSESETNVQSMVFSESARIIQKSAHDPATGERVFTEDDIEWLSQKSNTPKFRIVSAVIELTGLDVDAEEVRAAKNGLGGAESGPTSSS